MKKLENYGIEKFGRLKKVLLYKPVESLKSITSDNFGEYLFDAKPDIDKFLEEHDRYKQLLNSLGVEVYELSDYVKNNKKLMHSLPNLHYLHDS